jgi:hypothetical protein
MADAIAVVAPVVETGSAAVQAEGRALSLDVPEPLAVVALLRLGGARHGALVGLVVGLLACSQRQRASLTHQAAVGEDVVVQL